MAKKSLFFTYFLWLIGGIFGLHHFYLGRDIQGFLWWSTLGGYIGGWLRDMFHIPDYVKAANHDSDYNDKLIRTIKFFDTPPFSTWRFCGMIFVGYMWGSILNAAIPKDDIFDYSWQFLYSFVPLAIVLGVWSVGNIGHEEGSLKWPFLAAYVTYPYYKYYPGELSYTVMVLATTFAFEYKSKQWRHKVKPKRHIFTRMTALCFCGMLYMSLWGSTLYFNTTITDSDGEEIPVREALHHFFTSPWWKELQQCVVDLWNFAMVHGWAEVWKQAIEMLDPHGEQNAYAVLGLDLGANQTVINSRCRQLAVKWHPDKVKDPLMKDEAQEKFYEIQQACELLSTSKAKRRRQNKRSV